MFVSLLPRIQHRKFIFVYISSTHEVIICKIQESDIVCQCYATAVKNILMELLEVIKYSSPTPPWLNIPRGRQKGVASFLQKVLKNSKGPLRGILSSQVELLNSYKTNSRVSTLFLSIEYRVLRIDRGVKMARE